MSAKLRARTVLSNACFKGAIALLGLGMHTIATAHQFTRGQSATAGTTQSVNVATLGNDFVVTAVVNGTSNLEVIIWQYNPSSGAITRTGSADSFRVIQASWFETVVPVGLAVTGPNSFVTCAEDASNLQTHLTSWSVSAAGSVSAVSDAYTGAGQSNGNCQVATIATNANGAEFVVQETDTVAGYQSTYFTFWSDSYGGLVYLNGQAGLSGVGVSMSIVNSTASTAELVTLNESDPAPYDYQLQLSSWEINNSGGYPYLIAQNYYNVVSGTNATGVSTAPGHFFMCAETSDYFLLTALFSVNSSTGAFTRESSASGTSYYFQGGYVAATALDGVPITLGQQDLSYPDLRMDAWGTSGSSLVSLATAGAGTQTGGTIATISPSLVVTAYVDGSNDLKITFWQYE